MCLINPVCSTDKRGQERPSARAMSAEKHEDQCVLRCFLSVLSADESTFFSVGASVHHLTDAY